MAERRSADGDAAERAAGLLSTSVVLDEAVEILPSDGSEGQALPEAGDTQGAVHYIFPVEIEVRAAHAPVDPDEIAQRALAALARGLQGLHGLESA